MSTDADRTPDTIRVGFVPLVDCAIPVVAHEKGFADRHGLKLELSRDMSWASIRDKLAYGVLDAAHLLAGIPLACALGVGGAPRVPMIAPMALGRGGNGITVSLSLYQRMVEAAPDIMQGPRSQTARALRKVIEAERARGLPPLSFGTVFPVSSHNFELRYWLAAGGIDPDRDINLGVIAPPRMAESLRLGYIDGYCVGEPWNLRAVQKGIGVIVATKADIWPAAPEKVLGIRTRWAEENRDTILRLVCALVEAAQWADTPENHPELAAILAREHYVGASEELLLAALGNRITLGPEEENATDLPQRHIFYRWQSTFPWRSHGLWLLAQMQRWGLLKESSAVLQETVNKVYRPDIYRQAVQSLGMAVPASDSRAEGGHHTPFTVPSTDGRDLEMGPDAFMDGKIFDPAEHQGAA